MVFGAVAGCIFGGHMMSKVLDKAERVGVTLIRESGEQVKGVIDHGENAGGRLICRFFDATDRSVKLAIDRAAGSVQLLSDHLTEKVQILLEGAGAEVRLSLDHMQKNAIMILDQMPRVAGEAAFAAANGAGAGLRQQLGWGPAFPALVTQIDQALRQGEHVPYELVELVWTQPETKYHEKYEGYCFLMRFFQVNTEMTPQQRFAVQFFISYVALQDHVPQGFLEWVRGKRNPAIFTDELLKLPPGQEHLRDRALKMLQNIGKMTQGELITATCSIVAELQPPQLQLQLEAPGGVANPRETCKKGLKAIDDYIDNAKLTAETERDKPEKDAQVTEMKGRIREKIDQLKADHPALLSPELESCIELRKTLLDQEGRCQKIEAQRSKDFFFRELERENRFFWPAKQSPDVPDVMPLSEFQKYWIMSEPKSTQRVAFESLRWKRHYLDASTGEPGKGRVYVRYVAAGTPRETRAQWKRVHLHNDDEFCFESLRFKGHHLDASEGEWHKANVFVTKGAGSCPWARWKIVRIHDDVFAFESLRWEGHFLDASDGKDSKCNVYATKGDPNNLWAQWRMLDLGPAPAAQ